MTRAQAITALPTRGARYRRGRFGGLQLYQGGRRVMPRLVFVAAPSTVAQTMRRSAGSRHEANDVAYPTFAPLPPKLRDVIPV